MDALNDASPQGEIIASLKALDARLSRIEETLGLPPLEAEGLVSSQPVPGPEDREEALEMQIGQNWFAKAGIVGVALGIAFLLTFPFSDIPPLLPSIAGYAFVGLIFLLSRLTRESYEQISRYLTGGAMLLLYFTTLRLSYFGREPAVTDQALETLLLSLVVAVNAVISFRRESPYLMSLTLILGSATALLGGSPLFVGCASTVLALVVATAFQRFRWTGVLLLGIGLAYCAHLLQVLNNPLLGHAVQLNPGPEGALGFLLGYLVIFGVGLLWGERDRPESPGMGAAAILNGGGALALLLLITALGLKAHVAQWHLAASALLIGLSVAYFLRGRGLYTASLYAMLGYVSLSVAILDAFPVPEAFVWLCWQSILVVATAVWFRSRFIVVANFAIFLIVFGTYLFTPGAVSLVSISFGIVALLSARILNWQKDRLELKTEMMRNAYLGSALFVIPYALYHSIPSGFVSLSWLVVALFYYLTSRFLKLRKYRWMALLTIVITILRVFIVDLVGIEPTYRIISFLVLGTALLVISMIYTRRRRKRDGDARDETVTR